jgi:hypothetical protein
VNGIRLSNRIEYGREKKTFKLFLGEREELSIENVVCV